MGHLTTSHERLNVLKEIKGPYTQQNQGTFTRSHKNTSRKELYGKKAVKINATHYILPFIQSVTTIGKVVYSMGPSHCLEFLLSFQEW